MAKILIVDDEPELVFLTKKVLEQGGQKVLEAGNGRECMNILADEVLDLILLDIMLPGENGLMFARKSREMRKLETFQ